MAKLITPITVHVGQTLQALIGSLDRAPDGLGFVIARGARVIHQGCALDQPAVLKVVAEVEEALCRQHEQPDVAAVLRRITISIRPTLYERDGTTFEAFSEWQGGFGDRGVVHLALVPEWESHLAQALRALIEMELP